MSTPAPISAPLLRVTIAVPAWTQKQAIRIKAQLDHMFTGYEAEISVLQAEQKRAQPEQKPAAIDPAKEILSNIAIVPAEKVGNAIGALSEEVPENCPVRIGDTLRDIHTGAIVLAVKIHETSFRWKNTDSDAAENAREGLCLFAIFGECYAHVQQPETSAAANADSGERDTAVHQPGSTASESSPAETPIATAKPVTRRSSRVR